MTVRCEITGLVLGECAGRCCRPDLKMFQPVPEVWMRVTEAASNRPVVPSTDDVRRGHVHALFQVIGGRIGKPDVVDMVRELCEPSSHREFYRPAAEGKRSVRKNQHRYHVTVTPALLTQLYDSVAPSSSVEAGVTRPAASRPAARLDAIDLAVRIDNEAEQWIRYLEADDPRTPLGRVRRVGSLLPALNKSNHRRPMWENGVITCCDFHWLEHSVGRWWIAARILTGWDEAPWQPDNTCPLCGVRGTLRIRLAEHLALCVNDVCRETWDDTTIGLLADHIRAENNDTEETA